MNDSNFVFTSAQKATSHMANLTTEQHNHTDNFSKTSGEQQVCMNDLNLYEDPSFVEREKKKVKI